MVSLVLDATTANMAMSAIAAHADEREAHVHEVERFGQNLPEGSYYGSSHLLPDQGDLDAVGQSCSLVIPA
jgi:hypothetical protein